MSSNPGGLGDFSLSIRANMDRAKQDIAQFKREVQQDAVTLTTKATGGSMTVAAPHQMTPFVTGGQSAALMGNALDTATAHALSRFESKRQRTILNNQVRFRLASEGRDPSQFFKADADDKAFSRFVKGEDQEFSDFISSRNASTRERRLAFVKAGRAEMERHFEGLRRARDPQSDAERMRGGMPIAAGDDGGEGGGSSKLLRFSLYAYATKQATDFAAALSKVSNTFAIEGQRLGKISNQLTSSGNVGAGQVFNLQSNAAAARAELANYNTVSGMFGPIGSIYELYTGQGAQLEANVAEAERQAAFSMGALRNTEALKVRRAGFKGGVAGTPIAQLKASHAAEQQDLQLRMAESGNASFLKREGAALKATQADEMIFQASLWKGHLAGLGRQAQIETGRSGVFSAAMAGTGREQFIAERAVAFQTLDASKEQALLGKSPEEQKMLRAIFDKRFSNLEAETALLNRERIQNPGMAISVRSSEAGPFLSRQLDMQAETIRILAEIRDLVSSNTLN